MTKINTFSQMDNIQSFVTYKEILQQPSVWTEVTKLVQEQKEQITLFLEQVNLSNTHIVFTGAGTSEFIGNCLAPFFTNKGYRVSSLATTDLVSNLNDYLSKNDHVLLISFARSGDSPESVATFQKVEKYFLNVYHLVITCNKNGALSKIASNHKKAYVFHLPERTNDRGFAMTSSFSSMLLSAYLILQLKNIKSLIPSIDCLVNRANKFIANELKQVEILPKSKYERIVYLGSGVFKGLAQESHLKVLELSAGETLAFFNSPLGFRHGPKSVVNSKTLVVIFTNKEAYKRKYDIDLIIELVNQKRYGALVVLDTQDDVNLNKIVHHINFDISLLDEILISLAYIIFAQFFAIFNSMELGKNIDNPWPSRFVNRVVQGVKIHEE